MKAAVGGGGEIRAHSWKEKHLHPPTGLTPTKQTTFPNILTEALNQLRRKNLQEDENKKTQKLSEVQQQRRDSKSGTE